MKQQSKAVPVQSPVLLLQHIETLIGTASFATRISAKAQEAGSQVEQSAALKTALGRCASS